METIHTDSAYHAFSSRISKSKIKSDTPFNQLSEQDVKEDLQNTNNQNDELKTEVIVYTPFSDFITSRELCEISKLWSNFLHKRKSYNQIKSLSWVRLLSVIDIFAYWLEIHMCVCCCRSKNAHTQKCGQTSTRN